MEKKLISSRQKHKAAGHITLLYWISENALQIQG